MNFIGGFVVGSLIVVASVFGSIAYFLSNLGPIFVDSFIFLCVGLSFIGVGARIGSSYFSCFSFCVTVFLIILAIAAQCYGFQYAGWPMIGRGGAVLFGASAGLTYAAKRSNIWLWRFFSALSGCRT